MIGNGNVALDVARMLAKHADDLLVTEIPDNVYRGAEGLAGHGRPRLRPPRPGPGEVHPAGAARTLATPATWTSCCTRRTSSSTRPRTRPSAATTRPRPWSTRSPTGWSRSTPTPSRLAPAAPALPAQPRWRSVEGTDDARRQGRRHQVRAQRAGRHRQRPGHRRVRRLPGPGRLPRHRLLRLRRCPRSGSTPAAASIPNEGGRVLDAEGNPVPGIYATGWIKRGPVGPDRPHQGRRAGDHRLPARGPAGPAAGRRTRTRRPSSTCSSERGIEYTTWEGWLKLDAHERALGASGQPLPRPPTAS